MASNWRGVELYIAEVVLLALICNDDKVSHYLQSIWQFKSASNMCKISKKSMQWFAFNFR